MKIILKHLMDFPILQNAFVYIINNNKGDNNPYHNNGHLMTVFYFAMEMADYYKLDDYHKIHLGLVALFHDFNHNGKIGNDDVNLKEAYIGFLDFYSYCNEKLNLYIDTDLFKNILNHTEFPSRPNPTTIEDKIIMDSDMLSNYTSGWFKDNLVGISKEFGVSLKDHLPNQIKFIENLSFYTEYAQQLHLEKKDKILDKLRQLERIFKN